MVVLKGLRFRVEGLGTAIIPWHTLLINLMLHHKSTPKQVHRLNGSVFRRYDQSLNALGQHAAWRLGFRD